MVAMASAEEMMEDERPVHQGCMAGFLHLFDRPQILSGRRLHHTPRRLTSSSSGSATPSERSMPLDRSTPAPSSPDMTPPAAPRPSLQLPPLHDLKDVAASSGAPSWRLPRLSLDSRAVVDGRGKYRPREIRAPSPAAAPPSPSLNGDERRSPSVVARLMGLEALPHEEDGGGGGRQREQYQYASCPAAAALRRSASERVPRNLPSSHFRFVDPAFFERPSPLPQQQQRPAPAPAQASYPSAEATMRRAPADPASSVRGGIQRRSRFDAREVFPDPGKRASAADPASAAQHGGEIALYGEIERRLRKRGIAEPATRDLETLKQILEALQLKGLLHHAPPAARAPTAPPPIVVMRPSHRAQPPQPQPPSPARLVTPTARRLRVDVDRARRPRSPDPSSSPAQSPASPARRGGPQSPQRRVSPAQSPKQQQPFRRPSTADPAGARSRIARRAARNSATLFPDEEASTTFSDGGSSSSFSASSRWDFDPQPAVRGEEPSRAVLERCGKLLSSIQAFTGRDAAAADQQPSPVSVLDAAAFLADEDSPSSSSGSKRVIDFNIVRSPPKKPATVSDPEDDEWALSGPWTMAGPNAGDPDYAYVAELVRLFHRKRDPADVYKIAEQQRRLGGGGGGADTWHHRRLLCGAVAEALERQRCACPWDPASWLRGADLVDHVWGKVRRAREPVPAVAPPEELDLNDVTCDAIRRDLAAADGAWASTLQQQLPRRLGAEVADAVLQIERLVFKDLVADTIRELADADRLVPPRRKLVF